MAMTRTLIVNADDFGRSTAINAAVKQAHVGGILTSASLMAGGEAFEEAVECARQCPRLGVGLHLTLVDGFPVMPPERVPGLVDATGRFGADPVRAGWEFFFRPSLRVQLEAELEAQFTKFASAGLAFDHVNGHLHMHLHPVVFGVVMRLALRWGVKAMRLTRDPLSGSAVLDPRANSCSRRALHAAAFGVLSARAERVLRQHRFAYTERVFGLLQHGRVDEDYLCRLLPRLEFGESELYSHPSVDDFRFELEALTSPRVRELVERFQVRLARYSDLVS
ncbi:MAG: ChbG/HpnK family deacetylase [Verrucomicrobia bacterium]|nr:ChbG/HpnK family deacetylase [Verrucomicrobiota bacterium]